MPVSAWQAKSCALGLVCAGQAAHTRRSEIAARGASLHVSAFVHDSCCWSTKKVRYANFGVLGAKDGLEHAIELPALAVAQRASDASNHLSAHVDEEIEALARGTHRKNSHDVEQDVEDVDHELCRTHGNLKQGTEHVHPQCVVHHLNHLTEKDYDVLEGLADTTAHGKLHDRIAQLVDEVANDLHESHDLS